MAQVCYSRQYLGIESEKIGPLSVPAKITTKLLWLVLPDGICLISTSYLYSSILCLAKGTK